MRFGVWVCWYTWYAFQFSARTPVQARVSDCFAESRHISSVTVTVALRKNAHSGTGIGKKKAHGSETIIETIIHGQK